MLKIKNLNVILENINRFYILRDINLHFNKGEVFGLVGESGSGKTILGKTIIDLIKKPVKKISGEIFYNDTLLKGEMFKRLRGKEISMIFQNPTSCLNPVFTIENQLIETIRNFKPELSVKKARDYAVELLSLVEIDEPLERLKSYPHNLSGGMNQRVMIAIALCSNPNFLIADEPTTALDVTVQAKIINLLKRLNKELSLGVLFITHDLSLIKRIADKIAVIYSGEILEILSRDDIKNNRIRHPYTYFLNECIPSIEKKTEMLTTIPGEISVNTDYYSDKCIFFERCSKRIDICTKKKPTFDNQNFKCHNPMC
jgi:oligopeptide/dipeptide ABC transporter ATP-binding protein